MPPVSEILIFVTGARRRWRRLPACWPVSSAWAEAPFSCRSSTRSMVCSACPTACAPMSRSGTSLAIIVPTSIRSFSAHQESAARSTWTCSRAGRSGYHLGTVLASVVAAYVSGEFLRAIVFMALAQCSSRSRCSSTAKAGVWAPRCLRGVIECRWRAEPIGLLSGLMGIGGGTLSNLWMTLWNRTVHQSVATSSGVGVLISVPGLLRLCVGGLEQSGPAAVLNGFRQLDHRHGSMAEVEAVELPFSTAMSKGVVVVPSS
jgi:hypothetical protein